MHSRPPWCKKWMEPGSCVVAKPHHQLGMEPYVLVKPHYQ
ncbi:hypothetical protein RDI58_012642 [Solanum bulbocastanum]|uniref:Uncharacterized protein n=1 Tax=Solanum bulbocastanum TaxID=147425 RepID=A0AAN8YD93_SOLBU